MAGSPLHVELASHATPTTHPAFVADAVKRAHGRLSMHDALVKQSQRVVSQTFFGTLLKQMHESPFKSDLLDGGKGGKAFSGMLDQHLAERMARGSGQKLVNAMVHRLEGASAKHKAATSKKASWQSRFPGQYLKMLPKDKIQLKDRRPNVTTDFRA